MPMTYIVGSYKIVGASPDGDSIRFYPDDPTVWEREHITVKANAHGGVQLRLDAIDALETHYTPPHAAAPWHQPAALGQGAAAQVLSMLGFTEVVRDARGYVTSASPDSRPGYILTKFADKYGRAVAMAFVGKRRGRLADGAAVRFEVPELKRSINYQLLDAGWVYPTFYSKLFFDLRAELASTAAAAREAKSGVWASDVTVPGCTLTARSQLTDDLVMLPKMFRRLAEYLALDDTGGVDLGGFEAFLKAHGDKLYTITNGQYTTLDALVSVKRQTVALELEPEEIVFIEG